MTNAHDNYFPILVSNLVKHAPVANAYPPKIARPGEFKTARRSWVLKCAKGFEDSGTDGLVKRLYFSLG